MKYIVYNMETGETYRFCSTRAKARALVEFLNEEAGYAKYNRREVNTEDDEGDIPWLSWLLLAIFAFGIALLFMEGR